MSGPAYSAQPLGSGSRPLLIDRLSVAWVEWRGISMLSVIDLILEMSNDVRRRPWSTETQIASIENGDMVADLTIADTPDELEMVLKGVRATVGVRMSDTVTLVRGGIKIAIDLPDVYVAGLAGKPLGTVVAMPFAFEAVIEEAAKTRDGVVVTIRDPWVKLPISGLTRP